jgi:putative ABC transport system ATP-binding protein
MADLSVVDLTVEYRTGGYAVRPIDGLSLEAKGGAVALLLGPSGCGKTSLLSCVAALLRPRSGSIRLGGLEVTSLGARAVTAYRRRKVGIVFQSFNLVPSLTALENVTVPLRAVGTRWRTARARAADMLDELGLTDRMRHRPSHLSGGEQQRVAVARALALDPLVILADEPTAHLDYAQVEDVLGILRTRAAEGRVVIVATHDPRLLPMADQVVELGSSRSHSDPSREPVELRSGDRLGPGSWASFSRSRTKETLILPSTAKTSEELGEVVSGGHFFEEKTTAVHDHDRSGTKGGNRDDADRVRVSYPSSDHRDGTLRAGRRVDVRHGGGAS